MAKAAMALEGVRVLDLCTRFGNYCGKLFADFGADVVLVEPPGGSPLRARAPLHPSGQSLSFAYENTNKRSAVMDLASESGRATLRAMAAHVDVIVEDMPPGAMTGMGLGYDVLAAARPSLVVTSITPFGQSGPYAGYAAEDITLLALGGFMKLSGEPGGPPMRAAGDQSHCAGALFGAVATMLALLDAEASGQGQHVDVSMQEAVALALETAAQQYDLEGTVRRRYGSGQRLAGNGVFACADGFVLLMAGGVGSNRFWAKTVAWLQEAGLPGADELAQPQWLDHAYLVSDEAKARFSRIAGPWLLQQTKAWLYAQAQRRRIPCCPVSLPADLLRNAQLAHRGFFQRAAVDGPAAAWTMPGAPFRMSATPWSLRSGAPEAGATEAPPRSSHPRDTIAHSAR